MSKTASLDSTMTGEELFATCTDTANAEALALLYGNDVRFDHRRQRFLLWNQHRWQPDETDEIRRLAIATARQVYLKAWEMPPGVGRKVADWAVKSQNRYRVDSCIAMVKALHPVADTGESWDANTWLLGVKNGVVDLRTGRLRPGFRDDRITMNTGIDFEPEAECPRWLQFLDEVFEDSDLIDWLHRALGYSLTGDTSEQDVFLCYGKGSNGKKVFCQAIEGAMGDYAHTTPFSTFEMHQRASIPNDLAALEFKRFVSSSETNDSTRLNEARIKAISGSDRMSARYLHKEYFQFYPHLKLWLFVNHKPTVRDDSHGFWRRVKLVPFTKTFQGQADDKTLSNKLREEAKGVLAWLVLGCLKWQQRSIEDMPRCVKEATEAYRTESDVLAGFIAAKCVEHADMVAKASDLYSAYREWCLSEGIRERDKEFLTAATFGKRMGERYTRRKDMNGRYYEGIGMTA